MKDSNYITIQGWMMNRLNLKANDLMLFAVIYGFSQDGSSEFSGSLKYIQDALNCTRMTAVNALKSLLEKGLINKRVQVIYNLTFNHYSITDKAINYDKTTDCKNLDGGSKNYTGGVQNLDGGGLKIRPYNTKHTTNDNNKKINKKSLDGKKISPVDSKILDDLDFDTVKKEILPCITHKQALWIVQHRKSKKERTTALAFKTLCKNIKQALDDKLVKSIDDVLAEMDLRGWKAFKSDWLKNSSTTKSQTSAAAQEAWNNLRNYTRKGKAHEAPEATKTVLKTMGIMNRMRDISVNDFNFKEKEFIKIYTQQNNL